MAIGPDFFSAVLGSGRPPPAPRRTPSPPQTPDVIQAQLQTGELPTAPIRTPTPTPTPTQPEISDPRIDTINQRVRDGIIDPSNAQFIIANIIDSINNPAPPPAPPPTPPPAPLFVPEGIAPPPVGTTIEEIVNDVDDSSEDDSPEAIDVPVFIPDNAPPLVNPTPPIGTTVQEVIRRVSPQPIQTDGPVFIPEVAEDRIRQLERRLRVPGIPDNRRTQLERAIRETRGQIEKFSPTPAPTLTSDLGPPISPFVPEGILPPPVGTTVEEIVEGDVEITTTDGQTGTIEEIADIIDERPDLGPPISPFVPDPILPPPVGTTVEEITSGDVTLTLDTGETGDVTEIQDILIEQGDTILNPADVIVNPADVIVNPADVIVNPADVIVNPGDIRVEAPQITFAPPEITVNVESPNVNVGSTPSDSVEESGVEESGGLGLLAIGALAVFALSQS